jgi:hypothetical protein
MQLSQVNIEPVTVGDLLSWARERSDEELRSFVDRRSRALGDELDDTDFEIAGL